MSRTPLLVGMVLLALAVLTVGAAGSVAPVGPDGASGAIPGERPTSVEPVPNTTNYLSPDRGVERRTYATARVDVGSAVAASAARLESDYRARVFEAQVTNQPADTGRRLAAADDALTDAEARMDRLETRQESLFLAYSNGTLSRQQLLQQLVRLDVQTAAHTTYLDALEQHTQRRVDSTPPNFDTRLSTLRSQTVALPAPLTDRVGDAVLGTADPFVVYAEGVNDTLVLGAVDEDLFYRQATLRDAYRPDEPNALTIGGALQRATQLYPWVYSGSQGFKPQIGIAGSGLFRIRADHPQGTLVSYISGSTSNAFHESQTLDPVDVPVYKTAMNETAELQLSVTTTTQTGPMRVELTTPAGVPVSGTVSVDGQPVAGTGEDGVLWTVRPSGTFELTAVSESGSVASLSRIRFLRSS